MDGVYDIVINHYLKDNYEELIRNKVISTYGKNIFNILKEFL